MGKKQTVSVVLDAEVAKALKAEAEGRDRSMSWIVNRLLAAALRQPRRIALEEVLPEDPDWEIIQARRHEPRLTSTPITEIGSKRPGAGRAQEVAEVYRVRFRSRSVRKELDGLDDETYLRIVAVILLCLQP